MNRQGTLLTILGLFLLALTIAGVYSGLFHHRAEHAAWVLLTGVGAVTCWALAWSAQATPPHQRPLETATLVAATPPPTAACAGCGASLLKPPHGRCAPCHQLVCDECAMLLPSGGRLCWTCYLVEVEQTAEALCH